MNERFRCLSATLFFLFCLFLQSCTTYWTKAGFNINQWNLDNANCKAHSNNLFPPNLHTSQVPGIATPVQTNCHTMSGITSCTTQGGPGTPISLTQDLNSQAREQAWEACIRQRGYHQTRERRAVPKVEVSNQKEQLKPVGQLPEALLPPLSVKAVETGNQWIAISWKKPDYDLRSYLVEFGPSPNQLTDSFETNISAVELLTDSNGNPQHKIEFMAVPRPIFITITAVGNTLKSFRSKTVQAVQE